ncbi:hypothetical protein A3715_11525 [Oleiphilus sp. HI0009]|nr:MULTISPECIES: alpha/beta fold hydrolase [unclassified Oleiphilus]KZX77101.1 hypothetical protein A3715_11525 [Oleiphilus sp. HI0009]KZY72846.1 hypothetical protein A3739_15575 [Oleiphilus sp. HI0067]KZZ61122.1 hypothetical protein A3762_14725 [Oleiphilus sp. HI0125]
MPSNINALNIDTSTPILFVPGAMSGSWIWEDNFAQHYRAMGFKVHCMTFSGHHLSFKERLKLRFNDYVDECIEAIESFDKAPTVIGHSLGGLASLHATAHAKAHALILMSPVPISGVVGSMSSLAKKSPISLAKFITAACYAGITRYGTPPIGIYSNTCDTADADKVTAQLRSESIPVLMKLLSPPKLISTKLHPSNILFLAAKGDHIIPHTEIQKSADQLGADIKIYEGLSHTYQAESCWPDIADDILQWLHQSNMKDYQASAA